MYMCVGTSAMLLQSWASFLLSYLRTSFFLRWLLKLFLLLLFAVHSILSGQGKWTHQSLLLLSRPSIDTDRWQFVSSDHVRFFKKKERLAVFEFLVVVFVLFLIKDLIFLFGDVPNVIPAVYQQMSFEKELFVDVLDGGRQQFFMALNFVKLWVLSPK